MRVAKLEFYLKTVRDVLVKDQNFENVARILNIIRVLKFILNIRKIDTYSIHLMIVKSTPTHVLIS